MIPNWHEMTPEQQDEALRSEREREKAAHDAYFNEIRSVLVQRGDAAIFYQCPQIDGGAWLGGYCHQGILGINPQQGDGCSCGAVVNSVQRGPAPKTFTTIYA